MFDNGTEYTLDKFKSYCEEVGIHHQLTNIYIPQQNGVYKGKTRFLLVKQIANQGCEGEDSIEAWFRYKPSISHLKVFDCICFVHVLLVKRSKLERRSQSRIFLRYSSNKNRYMIYYPFPKKIVVSKDVAFDEEKTWKSDAPEAQMLKQGELEQVLQSTNDQTEEEDFDDIPVRGTRPIAEIYQRANVAVLEPASFEEVEPIKGWIDAMRVELNMICNNQT
ncbi:Retrovirus-related Pol polyprotein from transposon TNT 1-94 [Gossypium australe]|uniref:Retrovirus-related Pol polyprotein from transposon TNT 1-94 n=1 Tax=Gossypium australe TaxID=47621 RepID=A0A5B6VZA0_9ROSI|nr:Retrovirus-related Pol polyprotein from transposon TNT 1-94 [Gossypium australe]